MLQGFRAVFKRELFAYLHSPLAYIFVTLFILLANVFTFYVGDFLEQNNASLEAFFTFHPYLYLFFIPALSMRLWAEERKTGTIELLLTLPIPSFHIILAKFFAGWCFTSLTLALTFPIWITVSFLGEPDHYVIISGYLGSLLIAGTFMAIGSFMSALSASQIIAFILSAVTGFFFLLTGLPVIIEFFAGWLPVWLMSILADLSVLNHFQNLVKGLISLNSALFFISLITIWLAATTLLIDKIREQ